MRKIRRRRGRCLKNIDNAPVDPGVGIRKVWGTKNDGSSPGEIHGRDHETRAPDLPEGRVPKRRLKRCGKMVRAVARLKEVVEVALGTLAKDPSDKTVRSP